MKRVVLLLVVLVVTQELMASDITLVRDGQPAATIIYAAEGLQSKRPLQAARMLQEFIGLISGAELPLLNDTRLSDVTITEKRLLIASEEARYKPAAASYILIGTDELARRLGIGTDELGIGGIKVVTFANGVALLGAPATLEGQVGQDDRTLNYAVTELLERLGVRYLWPGESGLVVPSKRNLVVPALSYSYTPQVKMRYIRQTSFSGRTELGAQRLEIDLAMWQNARKKALATAPSCSWELFQRLGGSMPNFGHAGAGLRNGADYQQSNPEWFALQADGTRDQDGSDRWRLCKSNRELIEHVANDIIARATQNPDLQLVSLCPNDGDGNTGWCLCDQCEALDPATAPKIRLLSFPTREKRVSNRVAIEHASLTDRMVYYWNSIAEMVTPYHPSLRFGVSAYGAFSHPPVKQRLHPNLVVRYVPANPEHLAGWQAAGMQQVFWRPNVLLANWRDGKLRSIVGDLVNYTGIYAAAGMNQSDVSAINGHWATFGLSFYAMARLLWNPQLTRDAIIADFAGGFGRGAPHIERYWQRVEELTPKVRGAFESEADYTYRPAVLAELHALLNSAEQAAATPQVTKRVDFLRLGLNFTALHEELARLSWQASDKHEVDLDYASRLIELNTLMLQDIFANHHLALNSCNLAWANAGFARYAPIKGRRTLPQDQARRALIGQPDFGLTGKEQNLNQLLKAYDL